MERLERLQRMRDKFVKLCLKAEAGGDVATSEKMAEAVVRCEGEIERESVVVAANYV